MDAAFFRRPEVADVLHRVARCAAAPVAVHSVGQGTAPFRVWGSGGCVPCLHVAGLPGGRAACSSSRDEAARRVLSTGAPIPFVCHMGFACVSVALTGRPDAGLVLTIGPYVPSEAPEALREDAAAGLKRLGVEADATDLPFTLEDVARTPGGAPPEIAAWGADALRALAEEAGPDPSAEADAGGQHPPRYARRALAVPDRREAYGAAGIAAALAAGNTARARELMAAALGVSPAEAGAPFTASRKARLLAIAASVRAEQLEHAGAGKSGPDAAALWQDIDTATTVGAGLTAVARELAPRRGRATDDLLARVDRALARDLARKPRLSALAAELGVAPSTVSHRLRRRYGLSYSEYVGRLRVARAKELLVRTGLSVAEVARRVGIDDPSNFARLFRKIEGLSPADYRRAARKG